LGLAASTTVFTYLRSYYQPFPGADSAGLIRVFNRSDADAYGDLSYPDYMDLTRLNSSAFLGVAGDRPGFAASVRFEGGGTEVLFGNAVTGSFFSVLKIEMSLGRPILPDDDRPDAAPTVVLSDAYWRSHFAADPSVIGQTLYLNNNPYTIIGVVTPEFRGSSASSRPDVWLPFAEYRRVYWARSNIEENRDVGVMQVYLKLAERRTAEHGEAELTAFARGLDASAPLETGTRSFFVAPATWIHPRARQAESTANRVMLAAASGLLLLACANVANLLLSVAARRRQEMALRATQGATPWRLVRQVLTENTMLSFVAGSIAFALTGPAAARLGSYFDRPSVWGAAVPREVSVDLSVFLFAFTVSVLTGIFVGALPALRVARRDLVSYLWAGAGSSRLRTRSGRRQFLGARDMLVSLQVALSVFLLVIGGLVFRSLEAAQSVEAGFDTDNLVSSYISVSSMAGVPVDGRELFYRELIARFNDEPWVRATTVAAQAPLTGHPTEEYRVEGQDEEIALTVARVVPGFYEVVGMRVTSGRPFEVTDDADAPNVAIVNETLVRRYFNGNDPTGRSVWQVDAEGEATRGFEIVGVVGDAKITSLLGEQEAVLYLCYPQHYYTPGNALLVSPNVDPASAVPLLRQELRDVSPRLALVNALPYSRVVSGFTYPQRMNAELFSVLAISGLILATVGIFGVLSLAVGERTREIGVRLALGAPDRDIALSVASRAAIAVALGAAVGLAVSMSASRFVRGLLFGVEPSDPVSIALAPLILLSAAMLATWLPTRRALRVDAAISLREE
jgi:predicted permease